MSEQAPQDPNNGENNINAGTVPPELIDAMPAGIAPTTEEGQPAIAEAPTMIDSVPGMEAPTPVDPNVNPRKSVVIPQEQWTPRMHAHAAIAQGGSARDTRGYPAYPAIFVAPVEKPAPTAEQSPEQ